MTEERCLRKSKSNGDYPVFGAHDVMRDRLPWKSDSCQGLAGIPKWGSVSLSTTPWDTWVVVAELL